MGEVARPGRGGGSGKSAHGAQPLTRADTGAMADGNQDDTTARARPRAIPETAVERTCKVVSEAALAILLVLTTLDIVTRALFNFSFEVSDEVGGYMLVVITFFSLAVCHVNGTFHEVEFVQARL